MLHSRFIGYAALPTLVLAMIGLTPTGAGLFEASMVAHMLVQLPLLAIAGVYLLSGTPRLQEWLRKWDSQAAIALIVGSGWMFFWMLPMSLDLATIDPVYRLLKVISAPLGIGLCFCWVWLQAAPLLKIVVLFEAWAAITRLGWLYMESPEQLCSSYLIGEQQVVGQILLALSALTGAVGLVWGIFGSFQDAETPSIVKRVEKG